MANDSTQAIKALKDTDYKDAEAHFKMVQLLKGLAGASEDDKQAKAFMDAVSDALTTVADKVLKESAPVSRTPRSNALSMFIENSLAAPMNRVARGEHLHEAKKQSFRKMNIIINTALQDTVEAKDIIDARMAIWKKAGIEYSMIKSSGTLSVMLKDAETALKKASAMIPAADTELARLPSVAKRALRDL